MWQTEQNNTHRIFIIRFNRISLGKFRRIRECNTKIGIPKAEFKNVNGQKWSFLQTMYHSGPLFFFQYVDKLLTQLDVSFTAKIHLQPKTNIGKKIKQFRHLYYPYKTTNVMH